MKTLLFALTFLATLTPDASARGRNCKWPEDYQPGRRCADQLAAQEDKAGDETSLRDDAGGAGDETRNTDSQE